MTVSVLLAMGTATPPPTVVPPMFYSEIVKAATVIATATVTKSECRYEQGKANIVTMVTFSSPAYHKGNAGKEFTLRFVGGKIGEDRLHVPLMPQFQVGKKYLVYVDGLNGKKVSPIVGFYQGAFEITVKNGRETLISMLGDELIGVQKDRFVFAAKPVKKPAIPAPVAIPTNSGFKPALPNADEIEAAQAAKDRAAAKASLRPLPIAGYSNGNVKGPDSEGKSPAKPLPRRTTANPIIVPATADVGVRISARSLLTVPTTGGK